MALDPALVEVYSSARSDRFYVEALSIYHEALPKPVHITNWPEDFTGAVEGGNTADFISVPFSIRLPAKDTEGSQSLDIVMSNADQSLMDEVELMSMAPFTAARCFYRVYLSDSFGVQRLDPAMTFDIIAFSARRDSITASATMVNMHNRSFPRVLYNKSLFQGLDR